MRRLLLPLLLALFCLPLAAQAPVCDKSGFYPGYVSYADSLLALPDTDTKYDLLAEYYEQQADFARCDSLLAAGLALYPQSRALMRRQADAWQRESRCDDARPLYAALAADDTDAPLLLAWAQNEMLAGRIAAADSLFAAAYALDPQQAFAARYGFLYAYLGERQANRLLMRHLRAGLGAPDQWLMAGDLYIDRNLPYRALRAYQAAGTDSNFVAAMMTVRLREYLRPELYGRFEVITEDLEASTSTYRRSYVRLSHRLTDFLTANAELLNVNQVRRYDEYDIREERNISAASGTLYLQLPTSLYMGGSWQYYLNRQRGGDWTASTEQQLEWTDFSLWWKLIYADRIIDYGDYKHRCEYSAAIQAEWLELAMQASFTRYMAPHDEIYEEADSPWAYYEIVEKNNHGYHANLAFDYTVIDELSLGAYVSDRGFDHESRFYSSPARQVDYGLQATLSAALNGMDINLDTQAGMNDDNRANWGCSLELSLDVKRFTYSIGLDLDSDEYSSSRMLSFTISELAL